MASNITEIGEPGCEDVRIKTRGRKPNTGNTGNTSSATTSSGNGAGAGTGAGTGAAGTGAEEKKEPVGLSVLDTEQSKRDERNAKRRAAYAAKKPKKVNKKNNVVDDKNIKDILGTISLLISARPDMAHWMLTPDEIDKLAVPISNIISKSEFMSTASEHGDTIALVTACFTILMPRVVITCVNLKSKKGEKNAGSNKQSKLSDTGRTNETGQNKTVSSGNNGNAAGSVKTDSYNELFDSLPVVG